MAKGKGKFHVKGTSMKEHHKKGRKRKGGKRRHKR